MFEKYGIISSFSTKKFGDIYINNVNSDSFARFCNTLGIDRRNAVWMRQVHGNSVAVVSEKDKGKIIDSADGLISLKKGIFLVGTFADCVPILFFDKKKKTFGIAHAGWKGAYKEIAKVMVLKMIKNGSKVQDIIVGIGPSIKSCCYNIDEEREKMFAEKFPKRQDKIFQFSRNKTFLDLQVLIKLQVLDLGIMNKNIEDCELCTSDNDSDFYSFRKQKDKNAFNHFIGVIGRI